MRLILATSVVSLAAGLMLVGCTQPTVATAPSDRAATVPVSSASAVSSAPAGLVRGDCPKGLDTSTACFRGQDTAGAHIVIAVPTPWNGTLIVHAHGGPALDIKLERGDEDLQRWSIWPRAGYAYAASVYREPGFAVTSAADDTERVRRLFVDRVGKPMRTLLHGQSWGASVAVKAAERYATPHGPYDGVLLTSGVLGGSPRSYDFRLDLRVVYQALCNNHPLASEPAYPLWQGLPAGSTLTRQALATRVNACLGLDKPAAERTPEQAAKLKTIVDVIRVPETSVLGHLSFATWSFQHLVANRAGGLNPFGNDAVRYSGSSDDKALNAKVLRYRADPRAVARLSDDADATGRIPVPVLTLHGAGDATAFVELESAFRDVMVRGGSESRLVQVVTQDSEHSYTADPVYVAAADALGQWVARGDVPTPAGVAATCKATEARWGAGCRVLPSFVVPTLASRVATR
jgi:dienelactone hydrolase